MRKYLFCIITLFISFVQLRANDTNSANELVSDSIWLHWISVGDNNNVEFIERRNEYLWKRLNSSDYCVFLSFIQESINYTQQKELENDIQNPLYDSINFDQCLENILSCTEVNNEFKNWLRNNISIAKSKYL